MKRLNKKGTVVGSIVGSFSALIALVVIIVVSGLLNTVSAEAVQDIRDDTVDTSKVKCGTNTTGGSGGAILYENCKAYLIGNQSLGNQLTVANRTGTFTTSGIGLLLIAVIFAVAGGFIGNRVM